ncbi:Asp-tRNA(Asn)/Glu-tRNA(Gln) amidotransferase subunit GatC [Bartonella sp. Raccoon60]|uniref:Asp-tRNA(Asn)/Glu-tRNA(Gln) amidotransferase subunit GatC n=1 Tax=Bartonella sp. Raccoon60 TaxID=1933912 RepID=UPI00099A9ADC|nr:Asp-tRNA(Asn)/Glu-tRNA(Gln) amidotransferase subunit GatC [Bartonella sp. Raccoon60]AQX26577.1 aspartyl/glutamyl-tRNA(Asn/Gln) amidotransferasesubunit C [Bartonella sp. Raccoon60]
MSVESKTVKRVAKLARIAIHNDEVERITEEFNTVLDFVKQLNEVDVDGVKPLTSVIPMTLRKREDEVTDGNKVVDIIANAPLAEENLFLVPKVVE